MNGNISNESNQTVGCRPTTILVTQIVMQQLRFWHSASLVTEIVMQQLRF